jgi:type I restriction enzyme S subunit
MSQGWPVVPLGEVLTEYRDFIDQLEPRIYPKLSVKLYGRGVEIDTPADGASLLMRRHQIARSGQVILSEIWGKKGAIGLVPPEGEGALCTSHFFLFDIVPEKLTRGWLSYIFKANYLQEQLEAVARGTTGYAAVRPPHLLSARIPLPPLDEQRRVVARIDELAAKIWEAKRLRKQATGEKRALVLSQIDKVLREASERYGNSRLEQACLLITDGDHLTPRFVDQGVKFIFVGSVSTGRLHFQGCKYVDQEYFAGLKEARKPKRGDVLYSAVGATLGVPAIVDCDEEFCFQRHIALIRPDTNRVHSRYLWHMLRSRAIFTAAWASTTGSAQPTVPLKAIRALPLPLPPLFEQHEMAEYLDALEQKFKEVSRLQEKTEEEIRNLLPAILDQAFRGNL